MAKWIKANKFSILTSIAACGVIAACAWFLIAAFWVAVPLWAHILITALAGLVSAVPVYLLGAEKPVQFALRISAKKLGKDKQEQLIQIANDIFAQAKALEEAGKKEEELKAQALKEAQNELQAKQKAELEQLAQIKLQEIRNTEAK